MIYFNTFEQDCSAGISSPSQEPGRSPEMVNKNFSYPHRSLMYHDPQYTPLRQLSFCSLRLSFILDCASRADDNSPVPEIQLASNVAVKFGRYGNTGDWYAYVSWSPINGA